MSNIKVLGIDLEKNVFQLHGTDAKGKGVLPSYLCSILVLPKECWGWI